MTIYLALTIGFLIGVLWVGLLLWLTWIVIPKIRKWKDFKKECKTTKENIDTVLKAKEFFYPTTEEGRKKLEEYQKRRNDPNGIWSISISECGEFYEVTRNDGTKETFYKEKL